MIMARICSRVRPQGSGFHSGLERMMEGAGGVSLEVRIYPLGRLDLWSAADACCVNV